MQIFFPTFSTIKVHVEYFCLRLSGRRRWPRCLRQKYSSADMFVRALTSVCWVASAVALASLSPVQLTSHQLCPLALVNTASRSGQNGQIILALIPAGG